MKVTAENFRVAWDLAKTFLENRDETLLMLEVETEPTKMNYAIVKIPYGKDTSLLFSPEESQECMYPGRNMKYAGFYNYTEAKVYAVNSPLDRFLGFEKDWLTLNSRELTPINHKKAAKELDFLTLHML